MDSDLSHAWQVLFPPLQPHDSGWLDVGDGHAVHWEVSGHPGAPAALFLHGGPGAGCTPEDRRWFDPRRWRIVLMDQRGAGRSRADELLRANDTPHLVRDIEALRQHLGIESWLLFGGSWGATLALAYAQQHSGQVSALVLRGVWLATQAEHEWLYGPRGAAARHPMAWQRLRAAVGARGCLLEAMNERLQHDDPAAALAWLAWEQDLMNAECSLNAGPCTPPAIAQALAQARIGVHYARHRGFLDEGQLLSGMAMLRGIPAAVVQGARDLITPAAMNRALQGAWPQAQWFEVPAAGHASGHPAVARLLVQATQRFASAPPSGDDTP
jgi:proline iminopeptidase